MSASLLQRQTEAMWRAVAEARQGKTAAYLLLDGMARWNPPSERLKQAALRNAISAMIREDVRKKHPRQRIR
jgi:hypothetical protein